MSSSKQELKSSQTTAATTAGKAGNPFLIADDASVVAESRSNLAAIAQQTFSAPTNHSQGPAVRDSRNREDKDWEMVSKDELEEEESQLPHGAHTTTSAHFDVTVGFGKYVGLGFR